MKQRYRSIVGCLLLLLLPLLGVAQTTPDTVIYQAPAPPDTVVAGSFGINAMRIGVDLKPWIQGIASRERSFRNLHLRLDLGPRNLITYGVSLDVTNSRADLSGGGGSTTYFNKGSAARIGFYFNVIPDDQEKNLVTVGIGYGRSWFEESLKGFVQDDDYGFFEIERASTGLHAGWVELNGGMQARVWKQLYVGYNLQLRILPHFDDSDQVQIYEIPGFGKASQKSSFGFSYYMLYRIPFREELKIKN